MQTARPPGRLKRAPVRAAGCADSCGRLRRV